MSDIDYIRNKLNDETPTCRCQNPNICGNCFWINIQMKPETAVLHKCSNCIKDNIFFKQNVNILKNIKEEIIQLDTNCSIYCIWWDWFHNIRQNTLKNKVLKYTYKKEKEKEKENKVAK